VSVRACLFGWPGVCCMGSFPFLLLNIMMRSSPVFFEKKKEHKNSSNQPPFAEKIEEFATINFKVAEPQLEMLIPIHRLM